MTELVQYQDYEEYISTHILTKRMTVNLQKTTATMLFQLTSSRRGWPLRTGKYRLCSSISTHILTKRMTDSLRLLNCHADISTHILTKRMTASCIIPVNTSSSFQLTSSRRGWLSSTNGVHSKGYFNSHPHEEDDYDRRKICRNSGHFNSHPHEEDDDLPASEWTSDNHFNSHPHEEDDYSFVHRLLSSSLISTHILTKRMTAILNKNNLFKIAYYINNKHFISIVDIFFHFHIYF